MYFNAEAICGTESRAGQERRKKLSGRGIVGKEKALIKALRKTDPDLQKVHLEKEAEETE